MLYVKANSFSLHLYKNSGPGVKVFREREGCWAFVILNGEILLHSRNGTMEADQFIVAQGYHDALFI